MPSISAKSMIPVLKIVKSEIGHLKNESEGDYSEILKISRFYNGHPSHVFLGLTETSCLY